MHSHIPKPSTTSAQDYRAFAMGNVDPSSSLSLHVESPLPTAYAHPTLTTTSLPGAVNLVLRCMALKGNGRKALLLQEGCCIRDVLGVKLWVGLEQVPDMQVTILAQLAQLGLSNLTLHKTHLASKYMQGCTSMPLKRVTTFHAIRPHQPAGHPLLTAYSGPLCW